MEWEELLKSATIMDDEFMNLVFKYRPELFIKIVNIVFKVVGIKELNVDPSSIKIQEKFPSIQSKEATLDVTGETYDGDLIGLELQVKLSDFPPQRGNYYSASMQVSLLKKGMEYTQLPNHYLIVFCEGDIVKDNVPISIIRKINTVTNNYFDENREIYIDMSNPNLELVSKEIFNLSKDLTEKDPDKMMDDEIRDVAKFFKESEQGMAGASASYQEAVDKIKSNYRKELEEKFEKERSSYQEAVDKIKSNYRKELEEKFEKEKRALKSENSAIKSENFEQKNIIDQQSKEILELKSRLELLENK